MTSFLFNSGRNLRVDRVIDRDPPLVIVDENTISFADIPILRWNKATDEDVEGYQVEYTIAEDIDLLIVQK